MQVPDTADDAASVDASGDAARRCRHCRRSGFVTSTALEMHSLLCKSVQLRRRQLEARRAIHGATCKTRKRSSKDRAAASNRNSTAAVAAGNLSSGAVMLPNSAVCLKMHYA